MWVILELAFWAVIVFYLAPQLQHPPHRHPIEPHPTVFLSRVLDACDQLKCYSIEAYIEGFFRKTPLKEIHLDNLYSFIAWAAHHKRPQELTDAESRVSKQVVDAMLDRYQCLRELKPGFNPAAKHCTFSFDEVPYLHRPLLLYVLNGLGEVICSTLFYRLQGFHCLELGGVSYWIRQGASPLPPVVFFHGIAPGWSLYVLLIKLFESAGRTILLVDLDAVKIKSMRFYMPSIEHFTATVLAILQRHHIDRASFVGHSFGSIVAGWVVSRHPEVVSHLTLLDPVSLLLGLPDVAYAFMYRQPSSFVEWFLYLIAAREITVSYMLHRNFCWHKNMLWLEDIPAHIGVVVGIGSNDEIANPVAIEEYVQACQQRRVEQDQGGRADIHFVPWRGFSHGQVLVTRNKLVDLHRLVTANEKQCR